MPKANSTRATALSNSAAPKLLAGGNRRIPIGDGPVQGYIDAIPGWKHEVGKALDELIEQMVPGVTRAVRWNTPFYGLEGAGWLMGYHCVTKYFKVFFFQGTSMDPVSSVASKEENVRYVHMHEDEEWDRQ